MASRLTANATSSGTGDWPDGRRRNIGGERVVGVLHRRLRLCGSIFRGSSRSDRWFRSAAACRGAARLRSDGLGGVGSGRLRRRFFGGCFLGRRLFRGRLFRGCFFGGRLCGLLRPPWRAASSPAVSMRRRIRCWVDPAGLPCGRSFAAFSRLCIQRTGFIGSHHARTRRGASRDQGRSAPAPHRP